jgi:hypothetical protein
MLYGDLNLAGPCLADSVEVRNSEFLVKHMAWAGLDVRQGIAAWPGVEPSCFVRCRDVNKLPVMGSAKNLWSEPELERFSQLCGIST